MSRYPVLALSVIALVLGEAACGSSSSSSSSSTAPTSAATSSTASTSVSTTSAPAGTATTLSIAANPGGQLMFTTTTLTAKAGKVTINFTNNSPLGHNLTIVQGTSGPVLGATPTFQGGTKTLTLDLKPGTYTFYCSVPGHRAAGMQGTLTVS